MATQKLQTFKAIRLLGVIMLNYKIISQTLQIFYKQILSSSNILLFIILPTISGIKYIQVQWYNTEISYYLYLNSNSLQFILSNQLTDLVQRLYITILILNSNHMSSQSQQSYIDASVQNSRQSASNSLLRQQQYNTDPPQKQPTKNQQMIQQIQFERSNNIRLQKQITSLTYSKHALKKKLLSIKNNLLLQQITTISGDYVQTKDQAQLASLLESAQSQTSQLRDKKQQLTRQMVYLKQELEQKNTFLDSLQTKLQNTKNYQLSLQTQLIEVKHKNHVLNVDKQILQDQKLNILEGLSLNPNRQSQYFLINNPRDANLTQSNTIQLLKDYSNSTNKAMKALVKARQFDQNKEQLKQKLKKAQNQLQFEKNTEQTLKNYKNNTEALYHEISGKYFSEKSELDYASSQDLIGELKKIQNKYIPVFAEKGAIIKGLLDIIRHNIPKHFSEAQNLTIDNEEK